MTTKTTTAKMAASRKAPEPEAPLQYRVRGNCHHAVQVFAPEHMGIENSLYRGGDMLPSWAAPESIAHLIEMNLIEPVEVAS